MCDVNPNDYSAYQLRNWLRSLNKKSRGSKKDMAQRLNGIPQPIRGECPQLTDSSSEEEEEEHDTQNGGENKAGEGAKGIRKNVALKGSSLRDMELLKRELELANREKELLRKENDWLKKKDRVERQMSADDDDKEDDRANDRTNDGQISNLFGLVKELVQDYDGGFSPDIFIKQLENVQKLYRVDENTMKALLMAKLKGKAQTWLYIKNDYVTGSLHELFNEMRDVFGTTTNKLVLRRQFEKKSWKYGENFTDYFNDKVSLASGIDMEEDELVEYIIEGIPDKNLRVHACLQCFKSKSQLLAAFSRVPLDKPASSNDRYSNDRYSNERFSKDRYSKERTSNDRPSNDRPSNDRPSNELFKKSDTPVQRCYNCNSVGHFSKECRKPRREFGACHACGSMEHHAADCGTRKGDGAKNA